MASLADALEYQQKRQQMLNSLNDQPTDLEKAVQDQFGMQPNVDRAALLPYKSKDKGWVAPEAVYQLAKLLASPATALKGGNISNQEAIEAGNTLSGFMTPAGLASKIEPATARIVGPAQARTLSTKLELPTHEDFHAAIQNTPGAEITPEGLKLSVLRQQLPDQAGAESVRTGVFYLLASDPKKHVYSGKYGYGGAEKHKGETLLKRPLFVKGATGGNAPAQAYDQLMGKGAYESMRRDAIGVFNARDKIGATMDVLNKYGANPDLAHEIVRNSKVVNQLPYAIQENIVAHAVRNAGYDGVLGYSKTKTGPRLSELFDTRELTYPAEGMEPDIHEAYW